MVASAILCSVFLMGVAILFSPTDAEAALSADGGASTPEAAELVADCTLDRLGLLPCVEGRLDAVLQADGSEPAFQLLENLTGLDTTIETGAHNLAHHLGRTSRLHYSSTAEALSHCPTTMASGCFHGVLERHFNEVGPPKTSADIVPLCSEDDGQFRFFQCLHGLGHGLDMVAQHDLPQALDWCDLFPDTWRKESCAGGAFMENIVADTSMEQHHHHHEGMDMTGMDMHESTWVRLKPEDPQYPCNALDSSWWHACYWMQSSALLHQGKNIAEVFAACDAAPKPNDAICYQSAGRDISGTSLRNGPMVLMLCDLGQESLLGDCVYGAVGEMTNNAGGPEPGFAFCPTVPVTAKSGCYRAVGAIVAALHPAREDRQRVCAESEKTYVWDCFAAAGV